MRKILVITLLLINVCLVACQSNNNVAAEIEGHLDKIIGDKEIAASSAPIDYIEHNQQEYDSIINTGEDGLQYLTAELKSSEENGLKEWIMAKASTDILKMDNPVTEWSTGKEWINKYTAHE
ncbi:hypothetical protein [Paenibacillus sp. Z6-24]